MKRKRDNSSDEEDVEELEPSTKKLKVDEETKSDEYYSKLKKSDPERYKIASKFREIILSSHKSVEEFWFRMPIYQIDPEECSFYIGIRNNKGYFSIYFAEKPYKPVKKYVDELKKKKKVSKVCKFANATVKINGKAKFNDVPFNIFQKVFKKAFKNEIE